MLLRAGSTALLLLLLSRLSGLLRESAQAAAFGTSGLGDIVILMLTLPDLLAGILASGVLGYVLLPHWAQQCPAQQALTQRHVLRWLLIVGSVTGFLIAFFRHGLVSILAGGVGDSFAAQSANALLWSALAAPAAFISALWVTRLQHQQDVIGMYSASLVVNSVLVGGLVFQSLNSSEVDAILLLGLVLSAAMGLRLVWLYWRMRPVSTVPASETLELREPMPSLSVWVWAALAAGLPLAIPVVARSFASDNGAGALSTFNYAWKLVELPLILAIQLVAVLFSPAISKAVAGEVNPACGLTPAAIQSVRGALAIAWLLACSAAAALLVGAPPIAHLVFGWGGMTMAGLESVVTWGGVWAWSLLPQSIISVSLVVLAAQKRMRIAVFAYLFALAAMIAGCVWGNPNGTQLMYALNVAFSIVAIVVLTSLIRRSSSNASWLSIVPSQAMAIPASILLGIYGAKHVDWIAQSPAAGLTSLAASAAVAFAVIGIGYFSSEEIRAALRR